MTQVDFYVLQSDTTQAQHDFACRLVEKAYQQGNRVVIATPDEASTSAMDELLWTFKPESFLPHSTCSSEDADNTTNKDQQQAGIFISHSNDECDHHDVLVNLRPTLPQQFSRFKRLAEVVIQEKNSLEASRKSYAFYKQRGYPINTHKLKF